MQLERNEENHAAVARNVGSPSMGIIGIDKRTFWRYLVVAGTVERREIRLKRKYHWDPRLPNWKPFNFEFISIQLFNALIIIRFANAVGKRKNGAFGAIYFFEISPPLHALCEKRGVILPTEWWELMGQGSGPSAPFASSFARAAFSHRQGTTGGGGVEDRRISLGVTCSPLHLAQAQLKDAGAEGTSLNSASQTYEQISQSTSFGSGGAGSLARPRNSNAKNACDKYKWGAGLWRRGTRWFLDEIGHFAPWWMGSVMLLGSNVLRPTIAVNCVFLFLFLGTTGGPVWMNITAGGMKRIPSFGMDFHLLKHRLCEW